MKRKFMPAFPFLLLPVFTLIYNYLDRTAFVEVFGCGCVPVAQTNMLGIDFNANDLRRVVYCILTVMMTVAAVFISRKITKRILRLIYILAVFVFYAIISVFLCKNMMWN